MAIYDSDDFERRERERPSKAAAALMNRLFRGEPEPSADGEGDGDEDRAPVAHGGFDGGSGGRQSLVEPAQEMHNVGAELRGAMAERRERRIHRGGGSTTRPHGQNGIPV
jgi:hypothetical protein